MMSPSDRHTGPRRMHISDSSEFSKHSCCVRKGLDASSSTPDVGPCCRPAAKTLPTSERQPTSDCVGSGAGDGVRATAPTSLVAGQAGGGGQGSATASAQGAAAAAAGTAGHAGGGGHGDSGVEPSAKGSGRPPAAPRPRSAPSDAPPAVAPAGPAAPRAGPAAAVANEVRRVSAGSSSVCATRSMLSNSAAARMSEIIHRKLLFALPLPAGDERVANAMTEAT